MMIKRLAAATVAVALSAVSAAFAADPRPLTIVIDKRGQCPGSAVGHGRMKIAEFDAQRLRRQARAEGRPVTTIELRDEIDEGALRLSPSLPTEIRVVRPVC